MKSKSCFFFLYVTHSFLGGIGFISRTWGMKSLYDSLKNSLIKSLEYGSVDDDELDLLIDKLQLHQNSAVEARKNIEEYIKTKQLTLFTKRIVLPLMKWIYSDIIHTQQFMYLYISEYQADHSEISEDGPFDNVDSLVKSLKA